MPSILTTRAAVVLALLGASAAHAETRVCEPVASVPATLSAPGHYCLARDFTGNFAASAVLVTADDVRLDCNGHTLRNTNAATQDPGIRIGNAPRNVVVRNCTVDGFWIGIAVAADGGRAEANGIEDNRIVNAMRTGIDVTGPGSDNHIERNQVAGVRGNGALDAEGIRVSASGGAGYVIADNHVSGLDPVPHRAYNRTVGISVAGLRNARISGNVLVENVAAEPWSMVGIDGTDVSGSLVDGNLVRTPNLQVHDYLVYTYGIRLAGAGDPTSNLCRDNVVGHFQTNIEGCVPLGNTER